jgi:MFS family permease
LVTAFFAACLVLFYFLALAGVPLGIAFFLWIGIFNVMIVAQFWSFANDLYTENEGERLFPIVGFGASIGAVLGAVIAGVLIGPLGVYQLMLVGAALLVAEVQITNYLDKKERRRTEAHLPENETTAFMPAATVHRRDGETGVLTPAADETVERPKPSGWCFEPATFCSLRFSCCSATGSTRRASTFWEAWWKRRHRKPLLRETRRA